MKKTLALLAITAFIGSSLATPAIAAVKAGGACTKAGTTSTLQGKKYTCIKSGKKLMWDTGQTINSQSSISKEQLTNNSIQQSSQTDNFKPWSINATGLEVSNAAQKNFRDWVNLQQKNNSTHKFIVQDGVPPARAKNFQIVDTFGSELFDQYFKGNSATVLGRDEKWVLAQLAPYDPAFTDCSYSAGNPGLTYCHLGGRFQGYVATADSHFSATNLGVDGSSLLAHEYFHLVQNQMSNSEKLSVIKNGQASTQDLFPAWLVEGSANFVGFSVAAMAMGTTYAESRQAMLTYAPQDPSLNKNSLEDYEIRNGLGNNSPTYPYITGQLATEYLVASVGFQKMLDIWLNFQTMGSFEKSFEKSIGISKTAFYHLFENERINIGLPPVSWKLVCLTNTQISELSAVAEPCTLTTPQTVNRDVGSPISGKRPPTIDQTSNADGQGCSQGEASFSNTFGTFTCTALPNGNHLWKKTG
jgi:hypothetical protein